MYDKKSCDTESGAKGSGAASHERPQQSQTQQSQTQQSQTQQSQTQQSQTQQSQTQVVRGYTRINHKTGQPILVRSHRRVVPVPPPVPVQPHLRGGCPISGHQRRRPKCPAESL